MPTRITRPIRARKKCISSSAITPRPIFFTKIRCEHFMPDLIDLEIMMHSKVPLIVIETFEEPRAIEMIMRAGIKQNRPVFVWSITEGLKRMDLEHAVAERLTNEPDATLSHIKASGRPGIYILCDFHPYLQDNPKNVRLLKEIAMRHEQLHHSVILLSHALTI